MGGCAVERIDYEYDSKLLARTVADCAKDGTNAHIIVAHLHDFMLEKRLTAACDKAGIELETLDAPPSSTRPASNREYRDGRKRWFMADFYAWQRGRGYDILMDDDGKPVGGKWSFDHENRKAVPKSKRGDGATFIAPRNATPTEVAAREWVETRPLPQGQTQAPAPVPNTPSTTRRHAQWLDTFLHERFHLFGDYEVSDPEGRKLAVALGADAHAELRPALHPQAGA